MREDGRRRLLSAFGRQLHLALWVFETATNSNAPQTPLLDGPFSAKWTSTAVFCGSFEKSEIRVAWEKYSKRCAYREQFHEYATHAPALRPQVGTLGTFVMIATPAMRSRSARSVFVAEGTARSEKAVFTGANSGARSKSNLKTSPNRRHPMFPADFREVRERVVSSCSQTSTS